MKHTLLFFLTLFLIFAAMSSHAGEINTGKERTSLVYTSNGYAEISFRSTVAAVQFSEVATQAGPFTELYIEDYLKAPVIGDPNLPTCCRLFEVPLNQGFEIEITHAEYQDYDLSSFGISNRILPAQPSLSKGLSDPSQVPFVLNEAAYLANRFSGQPLVAVTPAGILRSLNLAHLVISPLQYNPVTNQLRIYSEISASVRFVSPDAGATMELKKKTTSMFFNNLGGLVDNYQPEPDGLITSSPVTYVIVSPVMFKAALQPLVKWKTRKGFRVIQAYTNDPLVGTTTTSIKNYLKNLYTTPPAGYNPPSFILFVGDIAQIPAFMSNGQATDLRYCEYTGDNLPEVLYGRFSASTLAQLQPYIDKTLEYEQYLFPDDTFLNEAVMIAGYDGGGNGLTYGNGQINYGTNYYFNTAHGLTSHNYLQPEPSGGNYSQQIRNNVSSGVSFANYTAHGSESGWADPGFSISNIASLQNNHKYCLMVGNCCLTSKYNLNCFAEEITRAANKGAIGYIGASNNSLWDEDYWWGVGNKSLSTNPPYQAEHLGAYDVTFHDHGEPVAQWFVTMAQMFVGGNLAVQESNSSNKLYYWEIYNLMGDPSLSIYYSVPPPVAATLPQILLVGENSSTIESEPWSYVAISLNDSTLLDAKCVDNTGTVTLQFPELTAPGYAKIVITAQNRKPLIDSILIINPTGPYITLSSASVNDASMGNNNGKADYGETVSLDMMVKNNGLSPTTNLVATIATPDTNVIILGDSYTYGTVPSGATVTGAGAFLIAVKNNVADQYKVPVSVTFTDDNGSWTGSFELLLNAPVMTIGSITVLDPAPGGNNNAIFDPGETVQLAVQISNTGHSAVSNTRAGMTVMAGSTGFVLLNNHTAFVGSIPEGGFGNALFTAISNGITPPGTVAGLSMSVLAGQSNQYRSAKDLSIVIGEVAQFPMSNSNISVCSGVFYDSGGQFGNYPDNQNLTMTISPATEGARMQATFTEFVLEAQSNCSYDYLRIYDGPSNQSPMIGNFCGTNSPGTVISTSSDGSLTFVFHSNYHNFYAGWAATLKCIGGPLSLIANSFPANICAGSSSQLVAIVTGGTGNYTYSWLPTDFLDDPTSPTPITTPQACISYKVTVSDGVDTLTSVPVALSVFTSPQPPEITLNGSQLISNVITGNQWYINGNLIPGATEQTYTPTASGDYTATVIAGPAGCESEPSNIITWLITGAVERPAADAVVIFPNPARSLINVSVPCIKGSVSIAISDAAGRVMLNQEHPAQAGQFSVDVSRLTPGLYFCTIMTQNFRTVKKITIAN